MDERTPLENGIEGCATLAKLIGSYYKLLKENGFSPQEALALALAYQNIFVSRILPGGNKDE